MTTATLTSPRHQELVNILTAAGKPLTSKQLFAQAKGFESQDDISKCLNHLLKKGVVERELYAQNAYSYWPASATTTDIGNTLLRGTNSTEIEAAGKALALLQDLVDAPEGWPTDAMVLRGAEQLHDLGIQCETELQQDIVESVFKAMLAAAPEAPAAQPDQSEQHLEMVRDAERYRWIKGRAQKDTSYDRFGPDGCHWSVGFYGKSAQSLDAEIDAAIEAKKGGAS